MTPLSCPNCKRVTPIRVHDGWVCVSCWRGFSNQDWELCQGRCIRKPREPTVQWLRRRGEKTFLEKLAELEVDGKPVVKGIYPTGTVTGQATQEDI